MVELTQAKAKDMPAFLKGKQGPDMFIAKGLPASQNEFDEQMLDFCKRHHSESSGFFIAKVLCRPALADKFSTYDGQIIQHLTDLTIDDETTAPLWRYRSGLGIVDFITALDDK